MDRVEADKLADWFNAFRGKIRMEYAQGMALAGFSDDVIIEVQQHVARNMIVWLEGSG